MRGAGSSCGPPGAPEAGARGAERAGDDEQVAGTGARPARNALRPAERGDDQDDAVGRGRVAADAPARPSRRSPRTARRRPRAASRAAAPSVTISATGSAADAARSLRLTAAAFQPRSRQPVQSSRKWTPSTSASCVTTSPPSSSRRVVLDRRRSGRALELGEQPELTDLRELPRAHGSRARPRITATPVAPAREAVGRVRGVDASDRDDRHARPTGRSRQPVEADRRVARPASTASPRPARRRCSPRPRTRPRPPRAASPPRARAAARPPSARSAPRRPARGGRRRRRAGSPPRRRR